MAMSRAMIIVRKVRQVHVALRLLLGLQSFQMQTRPQSLGTTSTMAPQVFFITGTSTAFGNELVKKCLKEGDKVVATAQNSSKLHFDGTTKDNYLAVDLDVTDQR